MLWIQRGMPASLGEGVDVWNLLASFIVSFIYIGEFYSLWYYFINFQNVIGLMTLVRGCVSFYFTCTLLCWTAVDISQKQETGIGGIKIVRNISQLILFNMSSKRLLVSNTFMTIYINTNISSNKCYSYGNMKSD